MDVWRIMDTLHLSTRTGEEMGLKEGQGEKEVILECLPILKNVPANQTLMYLVLSRQVGQHICCKVLLPV